MSAEAFYVAPYLPEGMIARNEMFPTWQQALVRARQWSLEFGGVGIYAPPLDDVPPGSDGVLILITEDDPELAAMAAGAVLVNPKFLPDDVRLQLMDLLGELWFGMYFDDAKHTCWALTDDGLHTRGIDHLVDHELIADYDAMDLGDAMLATNNPALAAVLLPHNRCTNCRQVGKHWSAACDDPDYLAQEAERRHDRSIGQ